MGICEGLLGDDNFYFYKEDDGFGEGEDGDGEGGREEMGEMLRLRDGILGSCAYFLEEGDGVCFVPIIRVSDEVELMIGLYKEKVEMVERVI
jgi:hypothetical protein